MVNLNCQGDAKRLDSRTYRTNFRPLYNKTKKKRTYNKSQGSGNDLHALNCEPSFKRQRMQENQRGLGCSREVEDAASEHLKQVDETNTKKMLEHKQKKEILEFFTTKKERKESLKKMYELEKDLILETCGESKLQKLAQLDQEFQIKSEGLRHEMDEWWKNLMAAHLTARIEEEKMRLKRSQAMKNCNIDSGNPNTSLGHSTLLESDSVDNTPEDLEICTSLTVIPSPLPSSRDLIPREILNMENENGLSYDVEKSTENLPMGDFTVPVILGEPVISITSSTEDEQESDANSLEDGEIYVPPLLDSDVGKRLNNVSGLSHDAEISPVNLPVLDAEKPIGGPAILITSSAEDEQESDTNSLEEGEICTSPIVISDSSPKERVNMENDNGLTHDVEISPDNSLIEELIPSPVDPDKQINKCCVPVVLDERVPSSSSSVEEVGALDASITSGHPKSVCKDLPVSESQDFINSGEDGTNGVVQSDVEVTLNCWTTEDVTNNGDVHHNDLKMYHEKLPSKEVAVVIGSDDQQIYVRSEPVPVDGPAFPISLKNVDVLLVPATPDNRTALNCSSPLLAPENEASEELDVPSDTVGLLHDSSCKETVIIDLDSDDEKIYEISAAILMDELNSICLSDKIQPIPSEQPIQVSVGCSMGNQLIDAHGSQGFMNQDTGVRDLRQQIQGNDRTDSCSNGTGEVTSFSVPQPQCIDQSSQLLLEQRSPTQLPRSEIRVTNESSPSCQYIGNIAFSQQLQSPIRASMRPVTSQPPQNNAFMTLTGNHLLMHQTARGAQRQPRPQLYNNNTTSNYYMYNSRNSYVRPNSYNSSGSNLLQVELERINKEGEAAVKEYEITMVQLEVARDKEIAQIFQKYALSFEDANKDITQKRGELSLCYEKTKAHKLLAETWAFAAYGNIPTFNPTSVVHQFSADQIVRQPGLYNPEVDRRQYVPNPHQYPSFPTTIDTLHGFQAQLSQLNQHPLNFCSSGSSTGSYSQFRGTREYTAPYNIPI